MNKEKLDEGQAVFMEEKEQRTDAEIRETIVLALLKRNLEKLMDIEDTISVAEYLVNYIKTGEIPIFE